MIDGSRANLVIFGILGALLLLLVQWLAFRLLPQPPIEVVDKMQQIKRTTFQGDYQGDGDIFELDRALMEAELEHPGSTLRLYYHQPGAFISRLLGSLLISMTLVGWSLGAYPFGCQTLFMLSAGIVLALYPLLAWQQSRPRLEN